MYDDSQSANSNRARLGNKGKVDTLDSMSKMNAGKAPMTIQNGSVLSSRYRNDQSKDQLMVSIKLNNCKNEQSNNNLTSVNRKEHAHADSLFNQSTNKSKALVTLPVGNSDAQNKDQVPQVKRKVTISFKDVGKPQVA